MANVTASTKQLLQPFIDVIRDANGELFTRNVALAQELGIPIAGLPTPDINERVSLDFVYDLEIPGDFIQRANSARILNPGFRMSQEIITQLLFPEIKSPFEERNRLTTEDVVNSDIMVGIKTIKELRAAAVQANLAGDGESESLLVRAADQLEAQLLGPTTPEGNPRTFRNMVEAGS